MAQPIWKDRIVTLGQDDVMEFEVWCGATIIYHGKSHKKPGETDNTIRINDICADYLYNVIPTLSQSEFTDLSFPLSFRTDMIEEMAILTVDEVEFTNDWSYDYTYDPAVDGMAFPINNRIARNQWAIWTGYDIQQVDAVITFKDGTTTQVTIPFGTPADFNVDFNSDFYRMITAYASGTAVFRPSAWNDAKSITINGVTYEIVDTCSRYALYYVNAHGGWDTLLIEGNHAESDSLVRHTREIDYDNRNVQNRGRGNYVNEIVKRMTLHTSWLSDEQSSRMHHLLNSTEVYLYDILKDEMIPVILTNTTTEYKTFKGNGGKMVNYAIEVEFANERIRR